MKIHEYNEMMAYLTRPDSLEEKLKELEKKYPGKVKPADELPPIQDPFKEFEIRNPREQSAYGGRIGFGKGGVKEINALSFGKEQNIFTPQTFQRILSVTGRRQQPEAYKIIINALKKAGITYTPNINQGARANFGNVTKKTIDIFNKEATRLRAEAGQRMSRYETEKLKKDIKIFVKDKIAKGEYVSRPTIKQQFGISGKSADALIDRGLDEKLTKKLGQEEKAEMAREKGKKAGIAKLGESDEVLKIINDEFKFDPDISNSEELAKKIYGDQFTKADTQGKLNLITQTDNDVFKYLKMLKGSRGQIPKGLRLPSQEKINDLIDNIETGLEDEAIGERGKSRRKRFRFSPGILRDYRYSLIDEKLGLDSNIFKRERGKFVTKGKNLDEIFGLTSSSKYAPGYAEAVQLLSPSVNKAKETQIDLPMSRILNALDDGRTTMTYKGKKNVSINEVVNDFNKTSAAFAKKNNIKGPKINLGGNFDLKNYINFKPESQKNIEQVFKNKNYFLSEVNNRPFETITQKTTADKISLPEKSKTRKMFENLNERYRTYKPTIQKFSSKIPGSAAVLAPYDLSMMLASGAPLLDALASAGSYFTKDPLIGKAVNIPLAMREMTSYGDVDEMLQRATARKEGIESMLQSIPSRFRNYVDENRGIDDETEEFVP